MYGGQKQNCCLIKVCVQKANDIVSWKFLKDMIKALWFPNKFISLIMICVDNASFTVFSQ